MTKPEILDKAIEVLRRSETLTLDAVAREVGLTKHGLVHHFATKQTLVLAVVDRIIDHWETDLRSRADQNSTPVQKLQAYIDYAFTGDFDPSDLALQVDARLRDQLRERWTQRLAPWLGHDIDGSPLAGASLRAARLLADGVWFNAALGIPTLRDDERDAVRAIAEQLIAEGTGQ